MSVRTSERKRAVWLELPGGGDPGRPPRRPWFGVLLVGLLGGLLAFCHGCHGDQDDGLSVRDWWVRAVGR